MRISRAPEGRSTKKHIAIATIGIVAVAAVVVGYLFYAGSDPISAKGAEDAGAQATVTTAPTSDNLTVTSAAPATPKPAPTAVPDPKIDPLDHAGEPVQLITCLDKARRNINARHPAPEPLRHVSGRAANRTTDVETVLTALNRQAIG